VPTITFLRENIQVEVPEGDHVRYPALENDVPVYCGLWKFANCHGNGLCGTDRVAVSPSNKTNPSPLWRNSGYVKTSRKTQICASPARLRYMAMSVWIRNVRIEGID